jgi:hypothetical protein
MTSRFILPLLLSALVAAAAGASVVGLPAWDVVRSPASDTEATRFLGIAAVTNDDIWAVGSRGNRSLTTRWDGSRFRAVPSPNIANRANVLEDAAGTAANDIWAVGHADRIDTVGSRTLILRWSGSAWAIVPSPSFGGAHDENVLSGVAAIAADDAWAVGWFRTLDPAKGRALTFHWNGSAWSEVANPCGRVLHEVFALSATNVWAVGGSSTCRWNGTSWTRIPAAQGPNPNLSIDLQDVSGTGPGNLWAVGLAAFSCGEGSVCHTGVIEHGNGSVWSFQSTGTILYSVHAIAADDIYAVGQGIGPAILHYDGNWETVPTPNPIPPARLFAVDAFSDGEIWAAGSRLAGGKDQTFAERAPSPVSGAVVGPTGVSGATVSWFGPETGSVETDVFGNYTVGGLKTGRYTFIASESGCTPATKKLTVPAGTTISVPLDISC